MHNETHSRLIRTYNIFDLKVSLFLIKILEIVPDVDRLI